MRLFEELLTAEDGTEPSPHEKIFVARKSIDGRDLQGERILTGVSS